MYIYSDLWALYMISWLSLHPSGSIAFPWSEVPQFNLSQVFQIFSVQHLR